MELLTQKYRRNPNAMVHSAYVGVAHGTRTVVRVSALNKDAQRIETTRVYSAGLPRGQGGRIATIVLGGLETTLDEVEYILEGIKEKKFVPERTPVDISRMCQMVAERRNDRIKYWRKNPSEAPKAKPKPNFYLPAGYRMAATSVPGLRLPVKV